MLGHRCWIHFADWKEDFEGTPILRWVLSLGFHFAPFLSWGNWASSSARLENEKWDYSGGLNATLGMRFMYFSMKSAQIKSSASLESFTILFIWNRRRKISLEYSSICGQLWYKKYDFGIFLVIEIESVP